MMYCKPVRVFVCLLGMFVLSGLRTQAQDQTASPAMESQRTESIYPPSEQLIHRLDLDTAFYRKHLDAGGLPIVASAKVSDYALREAKWIIDQMLVGREDIRRAIVSKRIRVVIMAPSEMTTDVPEHATLRPAAYWDKRARGLGATDARPAISCGEENVLQYPGDPYAAENILVHEFAHVIHQHGLQTLDSGFNQKLKQLFEQAKSENLWKDVYAGSNPAEYFAEAVQSWFGTNRENDNQHNHVNTRAELEAYDPSMAQLLKSIFGDNDWRYVGPKSRQFDREHLAGFQRDRAPTFQWPKEVSEAYRQHNAGKDLIKLKNLQGQSNAPNQSKGYSNSVVLTIQNNRDVELTVFWIDYAGTRKKYGSVASKGKFRQSTFQNHVWEVQDETGKVVAKFVAAKRDCLGTIER